MRNPITRIFLLVICYLLIATLIGCDAFVRKFTRKPKKEESVKEEMVLVPEEYSAPQMSKEELYRQYFLYWKSWQDELMASLLPESSHKRQIYCIEQAIKNLEELKLLLLPEAEKKLGIHLNQLKELKEVITKDIYGNNLARNRLSCERIKRNILRYFSYRKIKDYLL